MLTVEDLWKTYRSEHRTANAVRGVQFSVERGQFYTLLGPSGCGKTTTLRCVAGLERPDQGAIRIGSQTVYLGEKRVFVPSYTRNIGMVFQSYAIWPHMNVYENVAFPLLSADRRLDQRQIRERVERVLSLVQLSVLERSPASLLSGGQQQRVALARALVHEPEVLLLDEPLSNLDAKLREEMRVQIKLLTKRLEVTTLYVTHDQLEALQMSDRVAVMHDGEIIEEGAPREIYQRPTKTFTAAFVGKANFLHGTTLSQPGGDKMILVDTALGRLQCWASDFIGAGQRVVVAVRPEAILVSQDPCTERQNLVKGVVKTILFGGETLECEVLSGDQVVHVRAEPHLDLHTNSSVSLYLPPERCAALSDSAT